LGKEQNLEFKEPQSKDLRVCLCFPEIYEVGMSNLGFRIVYEFFSNFEGLSCERCFMPAEDLATYLQERREPLFSLETKTPLKDFDLLAFSLNYELNFINFLKMISLGGIELDKSKREKPLIIVGGLTNPEPLVSFVDIFFLGEFEPQANTFIKALKLSKSLSKREKFSALSEIEGVYIPDFYCLERNSLQPKEKEAKFPLTWQYYQEFKDNFYPKNWLIPYIPLVFDRVQAEVQRGCPNSCRFCQARCVYFPYRQRPPALVKKHLISLYEKTGYEEISLSGLSVIDYSSLEELLKEIIPYFEKRKVGILLPSLRPQGKASKILKLLNFAKKTGLTLALETANPLLRRKIGKYIDIDDLKELVKLASHRQYRVLKFYFMIGLPGESFEEVLEIGSFLKELALLYKKEKGSYPQMNVTISYFIPKPFTDFEKEKMADFEELIKKKDLLKKSVRSLRFIKLKFSNYRVSFLEYLLSRANRRISPLLREVFLKVEEGADYLDLALWKELSQKNNLELEYFLEEEFSFKSIIKKDGKVFFKSSV